MNCLMIEDEKTLPGRGREEGEGVPGSKEEGGWQVWEAVAEYNVARVAGTITPRAHLLLSHSITHLISQHGPEWHK